MDGPQFPKATVVLPVNDICDTNAWYERALGFETLYVHCKRRWGESEDFANHRSKIVEHPHVAVQGVTHDGQATPIR
jgi:hypothetical protein